jgi:metallo-beta-lactamase family protein
MAIEITSLYESCMELLDPQEVQKMRENYGGKWRTFLPNLHYTPTVEESMAINRMKHGAIIIAGSGMCTGGRIRHHFKQGIWSERNTVMFVGFQARGTLGRLLVDGAQKINMFGSEFAIRARIETLNGFSAHACQSELTAWIGNFTNQPKVMLVHGEPEALEALASHLHKELGIKARIPEQGHKVHF